MIAIRSLRRGSCHGRRGFPSSSMGVLGHRADFSAVMPKLLVACVVVVILGVGCGRQPVVEAPPPPSAYQPPDTVRDATMVWSADSGVDLFSGRAALTRAAYEAHFVSWASRVVPTYPGFERALIRKEPSRPEQTARRGKNFGTMQARIQRIIGSDADFTAQICLLNSGLMNRDGDRYRGSRSTRFSAWEVSVKAIVENPSWPVAVPAPGPDRAHWQAPTYDVFTGWTVEFHSGEYLTTGDGGRCDSWLASMDSTLPADPEKIESSEAPPVLPAYPGWPTAVPVKDSAPGTSLSTPR